MNSITPFLWFNDEAESAIKYYTSVFKDSKVLHINRQGKKVFSASIRLNNQEFHILNGGPVYKFTPAVSFFISCKTQKEVDYYWSRLAKGGKVMKCGWVTDKFGLTWQVVPELLGQYLGDSDPVKAGRVMEAMLKMTKLEIAPLKAAYEGNTRKKSPSKRRNKA